MNVPYNVKVPVDIALDLKSRLQALQAANSVDLEKFDKKIKLADGDPKKLTQARTEIIRRGRLLTMNNMITLSVAHGARNVKAMKDDQIFKHLAETGVVRGRPREV